MLEANENKSHYVAALLLGVAGLLILLIFVSLRSNADSETGTAQTSVTNAAPTISSVALDGGANLSGSVFTPDLGPTNITSDTNTNLEVTLAYSDANSCNQVKARGSFFLRVHKVGVTCGSGDTNYNTCYEEDALSAGSFTCADDCIGEDGTAANIVCTFPMRHFVDPTNWVVDAGVTDENSSAATDSNTTFTVASTTAIALLDTSLNFGELALGATSTQDAVTTRVRNVGTVNTAVSTYGANFTCTQQINTFPVTKLKLASSTGSAYGNKTTLTTDQTSVGITLADQDANASFTDGNNQDYKTFYWDLQIPATGVAGTCTSTVTIVGS